MQKVVTSACRSWDVGLKKPRTILLLVFNKSTKEVSKIHFLLTSTQGNVFVSQKSCYCCKSKKWNKIKARVHFFRNNSSLCWQRAIENNWTKNVLSFCYERTLVWKWEKKHAYKVGTAKRVNCVPHKLCFKCKKKYVSHTRESLWDGI